MLRCQLRRIGGVIDGRISIVEEEVVAARVDAARAYGHTSWGYHSRASQAHRYVAMTVPKVACTTIKTALQTWEGCGPPAERWADVHADWAGPTLLAYPTTEVVEMLRSPDYLRFSFVRNPYSRLVSAWKSKLASDDPQYVQLRASIREACHYPVVSGRRVGPIAFRDAVACLLDDPAGFDDHWIPQVDVLIADIIDYDVVGRFEGFAQQFGAILRGLHAPPEVVAIARRIFNPTEPMPLAAVYDPQLARRVYNFYAADFETFGYHQDSWRST
jgi:Sulfotransferase family